ncbi:bifunctional [glutamine synthetase] adenylyltransferase/[glutamine synthetase]-adenylyl-L-tyrosine phosphorylase [Nocardioides sp. BP30]|uniref:bifunctional [glutamine synthetase] adenylyltransferase/[glutamine synthetase]-adenylyl-L-tyrosine phosphorylase n=1 Tax=Nocardioides sp. BP30 TaxID=3036374 RepID=UPI0024689AC9|nr:bifunctional [glutamine synthetase] adenylyltransferase/[glutamine synthetase]-adenylyl-L-tyrosine phosphorylase [Nocardioides sp. BP30]WGL54208.1 bifunctional [glutamine synthetase] adenylyltransferase/[glutamine synthetase]-adenylyl-L-tyrosine phosphorylase [Nocardioides sp. BP30]
MTGKGLLLRLGFTDTDAAAAGMASLGTVTDPLIALFGRTADPDLALAALVRLADAVPDREQLLDELADDEGTAMRLLSVLGASEALGDHLARHPEQWRDLCDPMLGSTRPAAYFLRDHLLDAVAGLDPVAARDALRVEYRRLLLRLAARDLGHEMGVDDVAAELSDLAAGTLEAALAIARTEVDGADRVRLAVIAMGKCGAHELNYVSDVDVIFVHDGPDEIAVRLASALMRICSEHTREGAIWQVDAALRPEGKSGVLSRTLAGHVAYYERWASTWEFQALLKARPVAGDRELGAAYVEQLSPLVWRAAERDGFVADTQAMRRRVVDHIPAKDADRELKLGVGGLRDVEFAVQLLQLVHGRADTSLRVPATLSAIARLTEGGYVGREDGEALHAAYTFLRTLEHRIQLRRLRRTHVLPRDEESLRHLGRSMGLMRDPAASLEKELAFHRMTVGRLHQKLFYRPLLSAVARIPGEEARLSLAAAEERLTALGYADPAAALRHLDALSSGVRRSAAMQRTLLPVMLQWFAEGPDPDMGLFGFRRISEALGSSPWYLRALRDEGLIAERLARVLSTSRYTTALLEREPEGVRILGGSLEPTPSESLLAEMRGVVERHRDLAAAVHLVRGIRRRELFRISAGELVGVLDVEQVGAALSRLTDAVLESTLGAVVQEVAAQQGLAAPPTRLAIVAMGRYGGFELSYASDADVLFVHQPEEGVATEVAATFARAVVERLRGLLNSPGSDSALLLDADLRPEGRQGALVRTLDSYAAYYAKWSMVWEAQALLRADAVVGDAGLRDAFTAMIDPLRYPATGLAEGDVREVRRIKGRVDAERLPRGADPATHLKLGRGGLADIEWSVQLLQMRHSHAVPGLRTPRTLEALTAAVAADLIAADDADGLAEAWRRVSRMRNAVTLVRGRPSDQLPTNVTERRAVASILGYPADASDEMVNDYLRATRLASGIVDRVFWGD